MAVKIEKVQPKATVEVNEEVKKVEDVLEPIVVDKPMANVGMKVGQTVNLGNYESARIDISLFVPSEVEPAALDATFDFVQNWCDLKMTEVMKELQEATS